MTIRCPALHELPEVNAVTGWPWTAESRRVDDQAAADLPSISIVTPSFNQGRFLEATIRSVLLQGYPKLQYYIADGGSSDESVEVIRRYEPWLSGWVSRSDGGQYDAVSRGLAETDGQIMAYLNSDDMLLPGALWAVGTLFSQLGDVSWVTTRVPSVFDEGGRLVECAPVPGYSRGRFLEGRYAAGNPRFIQHIQQESTFWRRSLWDEVGGGFDAELTYAGDLDLWARFFQHADLVSVNLPLGGNRAHSTQKTSCMDAYALEATRVLQRYIPAAATSPALPGLWRLRRAGERLGLLRSSVVGPPDDDDIFHGAYYHARDGHWVQTREPAHD